VARTTPCDAVVRSGRMAKAKQFADAAAVVHELPSEAADIADAYVTLCVHAGIAGGDVICCARLGEYSRGESSSSSPAGRSTTTSSGSSRNSHDSSSVEGAGQRTSPSNPPLEGAEGVPDPSWSLPIMPRRVRHTAASRTSPPVT
jgi:hypothetical protein